MAKQGETKFKERVQRWCKTIPDLWLVKVQQVAIRGTPDLLMCYKGHFIAWELKVDGEVPTHLQQWNLDAITKAGGIARCVTPSTFKGACDELLSLTSSEAPA